MLQASYDGGLNWNYDLLSNMPLRNDCVAAVNDSQYFVVNNDNKLLTTNDGGIKWRDTGIVLSPVSSYRGKVVSAREADNRNTIVTCSPGSSSGIFISLDKNSLIVNGQIKEIDVETIVRSDRTFLPARYVAEAFGYTVNWDEERQAVKIVRKYWKFFCRTGRGKRPGFFHGNPAGRRWTVEDAGGDTQVLLHGGNHGSLSGPGQVPERAGRAVSP